MKTKAMSRVNATSNVAAMTINTFLSRICRNFSSLTTAAWSLWSICSNRCILSFEACSSVRLIWSACDCTRSSQWGLPCVSCRRITWATIEIGSPQSGHTSAWMEFIHPQEAQISGFPENVVPQWRQLSAPFEVIDSRGAVHAGQEGVPMFSFCIGRIILQPSFRSLEHFGFYSCLTTIWEGLMNLHRLIKNPSGTEGFQSDLNRGLILMSSWMLCKAKVKGSCFPKAKFLSCVQKDMPKDEYNVKGTIFLTNLEMGISTSQEF